MKSGSLTPNNIVVNFFSLQKENNVLGTFIKRKTKFSTSKVEKLKSTMDGTIILRWQCDVLEPGDKFHVPIGMKHRMYGLLDTELFEFSTEHFDEDSNRIQPGD